jgi:O-antigen biosynthesis protein
LISPLSAWNEHIPFASWIVEALRPRTVVELGVHSGVSYFAFCEAVGQLGLAAKCYAVDHWRGDPHSGEYGEEVYEMVSMLNQEYSSFSTLMRKTFDDAVDDFADGQIDLLHIDGFHTYEAIKHDFETWLPKMSTKGVVLLHDTAERKDDFGVYLLVTELRQRYPVFEFTHGHGLGLVAVGHDVPEPVRSLALLDPDSDEAQLLRKLYEGLGRRLSLQVELNEARGRLLAAEQKGRTSGERVDESPLANRTLRERLVELVTTVDSQSRDHESLTKSVDAQRRIISELRTTLAATQQQVDDVLSSTSWQITTPIRVVMDKARRTVWKLRAPRSESVDPAEHEIKRLYQRFDSKLELATRRELEAHLRSNPGLRESVVSIVMPTHDRGHAIGQAIGSVLRQRHEAWELLVIDDGSNDDTPVVVSQFLGDPRIRYVQRQWEGVGAARNVALSMAEGDIIAYLDSDNEWDRDFLSLMVAALDQRGTPIAYSATALVESGVTTGYRGDVFDFEQCLDANYIDINSFCHKRSLVTGGVQFDPKIRRTNDWDFILSLTFRQRVSYIPFIGVRYTQSEHPDQITLKEPYVFRRLVEQKHRRRFEGLSSDLESFDDVLDAFSLSFAIRTAATFEDRHQWGDHHLAVALSQALVQLGHRANVYYRDQDLEEKYDVVLTLRGLATFPATHDSVNAVWNISHPDLVSFEEFDSSSIVFVASDSYTSMLSHALRREIIPLLQGTDVDRFHPHYGLERQKVLLFVGNSRNVERPAVRYALDAGLPLVVYGSGWDGVVPETAIASTYIANEDASEAYATAGAVLNDHWESMRDFGFVSNRVYDALASGAVVLSDSFPELNRMFGDKLTTFSSRPEFLEQARRLLNSSPAQDTLDATAKQVIADHGLDTRAKAIVEGIHYFLGKAPPRANEVAARAETRRRRGLATIPKATPDIAVIPQTTVPGRMTSSAYIRLIQPLTSDLSTGPVNLTVIDPDNAADVGSRDLVVVSRTAVASEAAAEQLIELTDSGRRLVVDIDDAFHVMDHSHPQFEEYRNKVAALMKLAEEAAMVWCSTDRLKLSFPANIRDKAMIIANTIDPRLWRRYRKWANNARADGPLEVLYTGTMSHGPDLALVTPVFETLDQEYPRSFRLTVIGIPADGADPRWLHRLSPPKSDYPYFARWLRDLASEFDIGIAPLVDTAFNHMKSDIKIMEYTALSLPSMVSPVGPYEYLEGVEHCDSEEEWYKKLVEMLVDRSSLDEWRIEVEQREASMWRERRSAFAGESIMKLASVNAGR